METINKENQQAENLKELVYEVNDKNEIINEITRQLMRKESRFHQSTNIFIKNIQNNNNISAQDTEIYVHLRHKDKLWAPHHWAPCFGGVVSVGETYLTNAIKELEEEAGIKKQESEFQEVGMFKYDVQGIQRVWGKLYLVNHQGEIKIQESECEQYKIMKIKDIIESQKNGDKWAQDSYQSLIQVLLPFLEEQQKQQK